MNVAKMILLGMLGGSAPAPIPLEPIASFYFDGQSGDNWPLHTNCNISAEASIWETPRNGANQALRVTPTGLSANVGMTLPAPINLSNAQGVLRIYLDPNDGGVDSAAKKLSTVFIQLRPQGSGLVFKNTWSILNRVAKGWIDITFDVPTRWAGTALTAIDQIYITLANETGYTGYAVLGYLAFFQRPAKAAVMLRLDDGIASQYNLFSIAKDYGIVAHGAVIKPLVGNSGFMTLSQVQQVRDWGHVICNHADLIRGADFTDPSLGWRWANTGKTVLTTLSVRRDDVASCRDYMLANGLTEGAKWFIVPGGYDQRDDYELIADDTIDLLWYGINEHGTADTIYSNLYPAQWKLHRSWRIPGQTLLDGASDYTTAVTEALANKSMAIMFGHDLDATKWTALCALIATQVAAGNLEVVTLRDLMS